MIEYETLDGTPPQPRAQHEARTIKRVEVSEVYMMTEIGDGTFVQWGTCAKCGKRVLDCKDINGPVEPDYITKWRINDRFGQSFADRGIQPHADVIALADLMKTAQKAQDASETISTELEIELLREALEGALHLLGQKLPEPTDYDALGDDEYDDGPQSLQEQDMAEQFAETNTENKEQQ